MLLFFWIFILAVSLAALIKSSDYFTDSAEKIGLRFGVPAFIIGVTIVSIGTSLPELLTGIVGVVMGSSEIVIGNVVGSNITNIFLGLGILPLVVGYFTVDKNLVSVDLPILIASTFLIAITCLDGKFTPVEAVFSLAGFIVYIGYAVSEHNEFKKKASAEKEKAESLGIKTILILIGSCAGLYFSAKYTVESIIKISQIINIGTEIITASAVALGTSLPEIISSAVAARKGKIEIAVGTLLGSNIFNAFAIMGISGLVGTLTIPANMTGYGIYMLVLATLLYFFITLDREVTKWEGWMLIIFYGIFLFKLFAWA